MSPAPHPGLAEQGKLHALAGEHDLALAYYRLAMRLAVEQGAPEAVFRHYLDCTIESLELIGAYDDVLEYCDKLAEHYRGIEPIDDDQRAFVAVDLAANEQRRGAVLLKRGDTDAARNALQEARRLAERAGVPSPLADVLGGWIDRRLHVDAGRIEIEQRRVCYFAVTPESVDRARAVELPVELLGLG